MATLIIDCSSGYGIVKSAQRELLISVLEPKVTASLERKEVDPAAPTSGMCFVA